MSSHRATRDELLAAADPAGTLGPVVRAATAPAHDDELAGEGAALAAFRAAATTTRPSRFRAVVTRLLTVKAVVAVSVAGSAGIVLAATGSLPSPWSEPTPPPVTTPAPSPSSGVDRRVEDVDPGKQQPGKPAVPPRHDSEPGRSGEKPGRSDESDRPDRPGKQDKPAKPVKPSDRDDDHDEGEDEDDGARDDENEDQENQRPAPDPGEPTHLRPGHGRPHAPGNPPSGVTPTVPPSDVTTPSPGG
jgi:hypothetical protein